MDGASQLTAGARTGARKIVIMNSIGKLPVIVVILCCSLYAAPTGRIQGTVRDPAGEAAAQAVVTIENRAIGFRRAVVPHADGAFEFLEVAPGQWSLSVDAEGFKRVSIP